MFYIMIAVFVLGYVCIALEHPLRVNKAAFALLLGVTLWTLFACINPASLPSYSDAAEYLRANPDSSFLGWLTHNALIKHLGEIAEILFFLLGAMTIVELVDTHGGFGIITSRIRATKKVPLLWLVSVITFVMSAVLDNLTTSIVMIALMRKLIDNKQDRWMFGGMIIIAANSGGAWSPIGDITTIMLWIAGKVSTLNIISGVILPSLVSLIVPLVILSFMMKGSVERPRKEDNQEHIQLKIWERNFIFFMGVGFLLFVPVFKTVTHLPPYLGILGGLSVLWITTEILHRNRSTFEQGQLSVTAILRRVDTSSILFFLGILVAVAALQSCGQLMMLSRSLENIPIEGTGKYDLIAVILGALSSIVDNVPLVAGAMGMYDFPMDHRFWEFIAYTAGTGGSMLIIGSAAGVAVMGMEKIDFIWYLKRITPLALAGYIAGCAVYMFF
ncbi:MAG: sodium:proton antiporter NhaD [Bacteroidales bacterium]|jgi:Na+/H+ antiporter NhaD/arsenite permease-like protein|nr:sodium:proton antiporter NhaD [Bacteroidales bacterium]